MYRQFINSCTKYGLRAWASCVGSPDAEHGKDQAPVWRHMELVRNTPQAPHACGRGEGGGCSRRAEAGANTRGRCVLRTDGCSGGSLWVPVRARLGGAQGNPPSSVFNKAAFKEGAAQTLQTGQSARGSPGHPLEGGGLQARRRAGNRPLKCPWVSGAAGRSLGEGPCSGAPALRSQQGPSKNDRLGVQPSLVLGAAGRGDSVPSSEGASR